MVSLTGHGVGKGNAGYVLCEDNGETLCEMKLDVAVEEPRSGVIGGEANRDFVIRTNANVDDVANNRIVVVVHIRVCAANDTKGMLRGNVSTGK